MKRKAPKVFIARTPSPASSERAAEIEKRRAVLMERIGVARANPDAQVDYGQSGGAADKILGQLGLGGSGGIAQSGRIPDDTASLVVFATREAFDGPSQPANHGQNTVYFKPPAVLQSLHGRRGNADFAAQLGPRQTARLSFSIKRLIERDSIETPHARPLKDCADPKVLYPFSLQYARTRE